MRLAHEVKGEGQALVLLHGGFGLDHSYFLPWLHELPARLVLPDLRGCGKSPRDGLEDASLETLAQDVEELRATLGITGWVVLGHGFGSYLALEYARLFPADVRGLVLVGGAPAFDYPEVIAANLRKLATPAQAAALQQALAAPFPSDQDFRTAWNALLPLYFHRFDPEVAMRMDAAMIYSAPALYHGFRMLSQFSALPFISDLKVPALVATGQHDWIAPPAQGARRLARGLPGARLHIFEESGHFPFIEETSGFLQLVGDFVQATAGKP